MRYPFLLITVLLTAGVYTASVLLTDDSRLDFTDRSALYTDAPFVGRERAAINVLTNLGVIAGNPDGSFRPRRLLNRAEFVKVALLSHPSSSSFIWGPITCFPDTLHQDWFSPYVCAAKEKGIVEGYRDGLFRPAQPVTYGEAVKILTVLYEYRIGQTHAATGPWYAQYVDGAETRGVLLSESLPYMSSLTRGQMARLAAAFRAEYEGELDVYRSMESGESPITKDINHQSPITQSPNNSQSPIINSQELPTTNESLQTLSQSHFLLLGQESPPIADGVFRSPGEDSDMVIVQVILDREVKSINELVIVDEDGVELSWPLRLYGFDIYNKTFRWEFEQGTEYILPANIDRRFFVKAKFWELGNRGISEELIEIREFSIVLRGRVSNQSLQLFAKDAHFPFHQTVQSRIDSVVHVGGETGSLTEGRGQLLTSFQFIVADPDRVGVHLRHLTLSVDQLGFRMLRPELGREGRPERISCFIDGLDDELILCPNLPEEMGLIKEDNIILSLFADIERLPVSDRYLQVRLHDPGAVGKMGAIQWSDRVGQLTWVEGEAPLAVGTMWK
ncbi:S-layer homology domain-containing protein [Candidatus Peregrinibacteria bacterium]|nr:S-layer homology domain-containing protein [Candidatus Peregrinibacteria bacterium]